MPYSQHELAEFLRTTTGATSLLDERLVQYLVDFFDSSSAAKSLHSRIAAQMAQRKSNVPFRFGLSDPNIHAERAIKLMLELRVPKSRFGLIGRHLRSLDEESRAEAGVPMPKIMPSRKSLGLAWTRMVAHFKRDPPVEFRELGVWGISWPLDELARYVESQPTLMATLDFSVDLTIIVRGDAYPVAGDQWSQLNLTFQNHGLCARTMSHNFLIGLAFVGDKDPDVLAFIWQKNIEV
jgi:hypothetical protein